MGDSGTGGRQSELWTGTESSEATERPKWPPIKARREPTRLAPAAAATATVMATRAPNRSCERVQRPRLSVPSGNAESPPRSQAGGSSVGSRSCSAGSGGARYGAARATNRTDSMVAPPITARGSAMTRRKSGGTASLPPQLGVQHEIQDIDGGVDDEDDDAIGQRDALDERQIVVAHRVDHQAADAGIGVDHLDEEGAAEHEAGLDADQAERRQRGVLQRVAPQDAAAADTAQPRQRDVILEIGVDEAGAQDAHDERRQCQGERQGGKGKMRQDAEQRDGPAGEQRVDEQEPGRRRHRHLRIDAADEGKETETDADAEDQQDRPEEFRDRHDDHDAQIYDLPPHT